jgi:GWxTD domain-containing protein
MVSVVLAQEKPQAKDPNERKKKEELRSVYKKWMDEDVSYIITEEERKAFKVLKTDEERDQFIEQFWLRRDPDPDTPENEYKEEYYLRIQYANEKFSSGIPGWKTDRGRIYVKFGTTRSNLILRAYQRPAYEGGGTQPSARDLVSLHRRHRLDIEIGLSILPDRANTESRRARTKRMRCCSLQRRVDAGRRTGNDQQG